MSAAWEQRPAGGGEAPLSPLSFLLRSARVHGARPAVRHDGQTRSYAELLAATERLAGALAATGIGPGDRVAVLAPNVPLQLEAHFAVPGIGAVLVPLNTRLVAEELAHILGHAGASVLLADGSLAGVAEAAIARLAEPPLLLQRDGDGSLEAACAAAAPRPLTVPAETTLLSINYTSGTTGRPKGVLYTHRGAYLHALGVIAECGLTPRTRYLWTLPMFHCHGWAFTWAVTAMGGLHACLRRVDAGAAWAAITQERITHFCGAPTVLELLLGAEAAKAMDGPPIRVYTGGAPPSPATIARSERLNWDITHLYGLTETYGPIGVSVWQPEWDALPSSERARLKARQGVESVVSQPLRVVDEQGRDVPADGRSVGEIVMTGNNVTLGYWEDADATAAAFRGGVFHSGDLGVIHPDGYVEVRDRLKDVIISGGENISSIELEQVLAAYPQVAQAAVVAVPHPKWGETPCAFVVPAEGAGTLSVDNLCAYARDHLAGYKLPSRFVVVDALPLNSTGKIEKFRLRELARTGAG